MPRKKQKRRKKKKKRQVRQAVNQSSNQLLNYLRSQATPEYSQQGASMRESGFKARQPLSQNELEAVAQFEGMSTKYLSKHDTRVLDNLRARTIYNEGAAGPGFRRRGRGDVNFAGDFASSRRRGSGGAGTSFDRDERSSASSARPRRFSVGSVGATDLLRKFDEVDLDTSTASGFTPGTDERAQRRRDFLEQSPPREKQLGGNFISPAGESRFQGRRDAAATAGGFFLNQVNQGGSRGPRKTSSKTTLFGRP